MRYLVILQHRNFKNLYLNKGSKGMKSPYRKPSNTRYALSILIGLLALTGCTTVQKGAAVGGAAGAALGGIIGHQSGHGAEGAGIGAAVGAITGAIVGEQLEVKFCPKCGKEYTEGVKYCSVDGTELQYKKK